jgi:hypothetical protein
MSQDPVSTSAAGWCMQKCTLSTACSLQRCCCIAGEGMVSAMRQRAQHASEFMRLSVCNQSTWVEVAWQLRLVRHLLTVQCMSMIRLVSYANRHKMWLQRVLEHTLYCEANRRRDYGPSMWC